MIIQFQTIYALLGYRMQKLQKVNSLNVYNHGQLLSQSNQQVEKQIECQKKLSQQYENHIQQLNNLLTAQQMTIANKIGKIMNVQDRQQIQYQIQQFRERSMIKIYRKLQNQQKIEALEQYLSCKKEQIAEIDKQIQYLTSSGINISQYQDMNSRAEQLKIQMEELEKQIQANDPLAFEEICNEQIYVLQQKKQTAKDRNNKLRQLIKMKSLQENLQKSNLVIQMGKVDQIKKQEEQKKQKLRSLTRHNEQLQQRLAIMKRQKKIFKKQSAQEIQLKKQYEQTHRQILKLEQQYRQINKQNQNLDNTIKKYCSNQKLSELQAQIAQLKEIVTQCQQDDKMQELSQKILELGVQINQARKQRKKKLQKKEKRLSQLKDAVQNFEVLVGNYGMQNKQIQIQVSLIRQSLSQQQASNYSSNQCMINNKIVQKAQRPNITKIKDQKCARTSKQQQKQWFNKIVAKLFQFIFLFLFAMLLCDIQY